MKHVHINDGGQAVVADQFHLHGGKNGKSSKQSHATRAAGGGPALPSEDTQGNGVPISSGERPEKVPDARRN